MGFFALLLVSAGSVGAYFSGAFSTPAPAQDAEVLTTEDFRLGAILFVPTKGPNCEVHRFDNFTGNVIPDGVVNCERKIMPERSDAFAVGTQRRERMQSVLEGFKR